MFPHPRLRRKGEAGFSTVCTQAGGVAAGNGEAGAFLRTPASLASKPPTTAYFMPAKNAA